MRYVRGFSLSRAVFVAGSLVTVLVLSASDADAQETRKAPKVQRSASSTDPGSIGTRRNALREVPPQCEDGRALAAQIMAGGPVDRMVRHRSLGSLDASMGLPTPPLEARMQPRNARLELLRKDLGITRSGGDSEISRSMRSMQMSRAPGQIMHGC